MTGSTTRTLRHSDQEKSAPATDNNKSALLTLTHWLGWDLRTLVALLELLPLRVPLATLARCRMNLHQRRCAPDQGCSVATWLDTRVALNTDACTSEQGRTLTSLPP